MYTIGDLVKSFNISRSTILYYDRLGLLSPTKRGDNNYRLYDEVEVAKLDKIIMYRDLGVPLLKIINLLEVDNSKTSEILVSRLNKIQKDIIHLKRQEGLILEVLRQEVIEGKNTSFTKESWTELLLKLGYKEKDWIKWHKEFETDSPKEHNKFLRSLGMSEDEISKLLNIIKKRRYNLPLIIPLTKPTNSQ